MVFSSPRRSWRFHIMLTTPCAAFASGRRPWTWKVKIILYIMMLLFFLPGHWIERPLRSHHSTFHSSLLTQYSEHQYQAIIITTSRLPWCPSNITQKLMLSPMYHTHIYIHCTYAYSIHVLINTYALPYFCIAEEISVLPWIVHVKLSVFPMCLECANHTAVVT